MPVFGVQILSVSASDLKRQKLAHLLGDECVGAGAAIHTIPGSCNDWLSLESVGLISAELVRRLLPLPPC